MSKKKKRKTNRPTLDQTHTRRTFHVENKLLQKLDELADKSHASGFRKEFVNHAIRKALRD
jgi:metal-responsive CopG/Arc/MetJ family transcriptional regulator